MGERTQQTDRSQQLNNAYGDDKRGNRQDQEAGWVLV